MKNKFNCKTGDLLQNLVPLQISNDDDSDWRAEPGELFLVYDVIYDNNNEVEDYTLFSPTEQKYSLWESESVEYSNYFRKIK
jgi:hypothetical protein